MAQSGALLSNAKLNESPNGTMPQDVNFAALYRDRFAFVWRNLRRLGVAEVALRDAAQDVFIVVHRRLAEFTGRGSVEAWLYSILRRVAADYRRRARRKDLTDVEQPETVIDDQEPGPEGRAARSEAVRLLLQLLRELDEDKCDMLVLVDLEGLSVPEAAQAVNCNVNTAYSRLRAARQSMQAGFERHSAEERSQP
jgi:RNA polymerase sigma-70 factor (ECF subfamily)